MAANADVVLGSDGRVDGQYSTAANDGLLMHEMQMMQQHQLGLQPLEATPLTHSTGTEGTAYVVSRLGLTGVKGSVRYVGKIPKTILPFVLLCSLCRLAGWQGAWLRYVNMVFLPVINAHFISYMAPEVALGGVYDQSIDVYSFALVVWEWIHGKKPYIGLDVDTHARVVCMGGGRPDIDRHVPAPVADILRSAWKVIYVFFTSNLRYLHTWFPALSRGDLTSNL